jgi:hypothetical protein
MHTQTGDTICALSTPPGKGAIAVIRISGPGTFGLCDRFFRPAKKDQSLSAAASNTTSPSASSRRIGAVAYNYQYSLGLFTYKNRPGERMDNLGFIEAVHRSHGDVAQLFGPAILTEDAADVSAALKHIRRQTVNRAEVRPIADIDAMPHEEHLKFEAGQSQRCISHLRKLLASPSR